MNIDGLQELIMNRTTSSTKPDTTRYATHLNELSPPLGRVNVPARVDVRHFRRETNAVARQSKKLATS